MSSDKTGHRHTPKLKSIRDFFTIFPWLFGKTFQCEKCGKEIRPKEKFRYTFFYLVWFSASSDFCIFIGKKLIGQGTFMQQTLPAFLYYFLIVLIGIILTVLCVFVIPTIIMKYVCKFEEVLE